MAAGRRAGSSAGRRGRGRGGRRGGRRLRGGRGAPAARRAVDRAVQRRLVRPGAVVAPAEAGPRTEWPGPALLHRHVVVAAAGDVGVPEAADGGAGRQVELDAPGADAGAGAVGDGDPALVAGPPVLGRGECRGDASGAERRGHRYRRHGQRHDGAGPEGAAERSLHEAPPQTVRKLSKSMGRRYSHRHHFVKMRIRRFITRGIAREASAARGRRRRVASRHDRLRHRDRRADRRIRRPDRLPGPGPAGGERGLPLRPHPAVRRPPGAGHRVRRPGPGGARRAVQPVRRPGARHGHRDRRVLPGQLSRHLPADREGRRERPGRHPLYAALVDTPDAEGHTGDVRWNFEKFLVAPDGTVAARFAPTVTPDSAELRAAIDKVLPH